VNIVHRLTEGHVLSRGWQKYFRPLPGTDGGREIGKQVADLDAGSPAAQYAGGRLYFLRGKPMCHVGLAAFAALATFNFFSTDCAHKSATK